MELQVEGHTNLVRDMATGAIINTNSAKARAQKARAQAARDQRNEIEELKSDVAEIKDLLKQLLDR